MPHGFPLPLGILWPRWNDVTEYNSAVACLRFVTSDICYVLVGTKKKKNIIMALNFNSLVLFL
jgi:hypothetical protein